MLMAAIFQCPLFNQVNCDLKRADVLYIIAFLIKSYEMGCVQSFSNEIAPNPFNIVYNKWKFVAYFSFLHIYRLLSVLFFAFVIAAW